MQLQPVKTHILVRFYHPQKPLIEAPNSVFGEMNDDLRTRVEVVSVGMDVKTCKPGDFLLLVPKPIRLNISSDKDLWLIDDGQVLGVVLDDTAPITIEA